MAWTAQSLGVPLLLGVNASHFGRDRAQVFNSAAYVTRDGRLLGRYDKMHLVMFGECGGGPGGPERTLEGPGVPGSECGGGPGELEGPRVPGSACGCGFGRAASSVERGPSRGEPVSTREAFVLGLGAITVQSPWSSAIGIRSSPGLCRSQVLEGHSSSPTVGA